MPMGIVKQTCLKGLSREQVKDRLRADGYNISDTQKPLGQGPAKYIQVSKGDIEGKIGLIFPFEKNFCVNCNKIRITSKGKIRPCLAHDLEIDPGKIESKSINEIKGCLSTAIKDKPLSHKWQSGFSTDSEMSKIGG